MYPRQARVPISAENSEVKKTDTNKICRMCTFSFLFVLFFFFLYFWGIVPQSAESYISFNHPDHLPANCSVVILLLTDTNLMVPNGF